MNHDEQEYTVPQCSCQAGWENPLCPYTIEAAAKSHDILMKNAIQRAEREGMGSN